MMLPLQGNRELVDKYFYYLFMEEPGQVMEALRGHCRLEGFVVDDLVSCEFSAEYIIDGIYDDFYFGEDLVGFYFDPPYVKKSCMVVVDYAEFYKIVKKEYTSYAKKYKYFEPEIMELLEQLKKVLSKA